MFERIGETCERLYERSIRVSHGRHIERWVVLTSTCWAGFFSNACTARLNGLEGLEGTSSESSGSHSEREIVSNSMSKTDAGSETFADSRAVSSLGSSSGDDGVTSNHAEAGVGDTEFTSDGALREDLDGGNIATDAPSNSDSAPERDAQADICGAGVELCVVATTPSHGSVAVPTATHLLLQFNRNIYPDSGNLSVISSASGAVFEQVPLTDARVKIEGPLVTVDLDGILGGETNYTVSLAASALNAGGEVTFGGLAPGEWSFTTVETELPVADDELLLWVDPSFETSIKLDANSVAVAGDRSGRNNNLRQSSRDAQPTLEAVEWTSRDVLRFGGNDVLIASQLTAIAQRYDVFVVWRSPVSPPATLTTLFNHGVTEGVQVQLTHGHSVAGFRNAAVTRFTSGTYQALQFPAPAANQTHLWNATFDGARMDVFVDGRTVTGVNVAETPLAPSEVMALGGGPNGNFTFNGYVAELLYFGRSLSSSERSVMSDHLLDKWVR